MLIDVLEYGVVVASLVAIISLIFLIRKTFLFGRKKIQSKPQGKGYRGILYAFGRGMLPWEKESAAKHLPTYFAGAVYHIGIFSVFIYVFYRIFFLESGHLFLFLFRLAFGVGIVSGLGLLIKRSVLKTMRTISCPDDFFSNLLVDGLMVLAFLETIFSGFLPVLYIYTIAVLLYIPLGKIKHCFFFFYCRILFGLFLGRRGVLGQK
jgi:hypothetical protein